MPRSKDGRWMAWCEVCGNKFQQRKPGQRACSVLCRNRLPHNTGGVRAKAGLDLRTCQNPECRKAYQPVRENQTACNRTCLLKTPQYQAAQRRTDMRPERQAAKNVRRTLAGASDLERRRYLNLRTNLRRLGLDVTWEQYQDWLVRQDGNCKICGNPAEDKNGHTDHDHETGQLRDLLCGTCNRGIGNFRDDPVLLRAAAEYIERHRALVTV
jgi:hypothetical protein